jgi:hypothetical protein
MKMRTDILPIISLTIPQIGKTTGFPYKTQNINANIPSPTRNFPLILCQICNIFRHSAAKSAMDIFS